MKIRMKSDCPPIITFRVNVKPLKLCKSCEARKQRYDKKNEKLMREYMDDYIQVHSEKKRALGSVSV